MHVIAGGIFGLGTPELIAIAVVVLILFGAKELPKIGGAIGKGIREFKDGLKSDNDKPDTDKFKKEKEIRDNYPDSMKPEILPPPSESAPVSQKEEQKEQKP